MCNYQLFPLITVIQGKLTRLFCTGNIILQATKDSCRVTDEQKKKLQSQSQSQSHNPRVWKNPIELGMRKKKLCYLHRRKMNNAAGL